MMPKEVSIAKDKYWQYLKTNQEFMKKRNPEKWKNGGEIVIND